MRSNPNSNAPNAIPSQSCSFIRKCLITCARESPRETLRSSERFYFALLRALKRQPSGGEAPTGVISFPEERPETWFPCASCDWVLFIVPEKRRNPPACLTPPHPPPSHSSAAPSPESFLTPGGFVALAAGMARSVTTAVRRLTL